MWEPEVGQWQFVYVADFAHGHHYFIYTVEYTEEGLSTITYSVDQQDLEFSTLDDHDEIEDQLEVTEQGDTKFLVKSWLEEAADALAKSKSYSKYSPQFIKFIFKII